MTETGLIVRLDALSHLWGESRVQLHMIQLGGRYFSLSERLLPYSNWLASHRQHTRLELAFGLLLYEYRGHAGVRWRRLEDRGTALQWHVLTIRNVSALFQEGSGSGLE
jgi:hypothetical protein